MHVALCSIVRLMAVDIRTKCLSHEEESRRRRLRGPGDRKTVGTPTAPKLHLMMKRVHESKSAGCRAFCIVAIALVMKANAVAIAMPIHNLKAS